MAGTTPPTIPSPAAQSFSPTSLSFSAIRDSGRSFINSADHDAIVNDLVFLDTVMGNIVGTARVSDAVAGTSAILIMTPYTSAVAGQLSAFLQAFNG